MINSETWWLALQPYIHVAAYDNNVLFYNTLDHKMVEYQDNTEVFNLACSLINESNGLVVEISNRDLNNKSLGGMVRKLRQYHMATLIPTSLSHIKPVQILPKPAFKQRLQPFEQGIEREGIRPENFFHVLNIHLNAGNTNYSEILSEAFNQFAYPFASTQYGATMPTNLIYKIIGEVSGIPMLTINILGSDPTAHPDWVSLTQFLSIKDVLVKYHFPLPVLTNQKLLLVGKKSHVSLHISFPLYEEEFNTLVNLNQLLPEKPAIEYNFIITCLDDLEKARQAIAHFGLRNWFFKPYYNGSNLNFFEQNVYITKEDIVQSKPDQKQIFSRITFNENDFGKFTVLPDGTTFANVNDPPLGNMNHMDIVALVKAEMDHGKSWNRTRLRVAPCSTCLYNSLCPPVSSYEIGLNKYNFCHIR